MDDLTQATSRKRLCRLSLRLNGISESTVSKLKDIDDRVGAFLGRPLTGDWPYLWLDATYLKQREGGRIVSVTAVIVLAVDGEGKREVMGLHIGFSKAEPFWSTFFRSLVRRGLRGTKLVIPCASFGFRRNAHEGLKAAIRRVPEGGGVELRAGAGMAWAAFVHETAIPGSGPMFTFCRWDDQVGLFVRWMN